MRQVFLDSLPKNKTRINWNECIGMFVDFIYDDINGRVEICSYNKTTKNISIKSIEFRNGKEFDIYVTSFRKALLGGFLMKQVKEYRFDIGETVKTNKLNIKILEQIKNRGRKYYLYRCNNCGCTSKASEDQMFRYGYGCGVCANKVCKTGINDIATTHQHLVKYFSNIEDAKSNSINTHRKVDIVCPDCGAIRNISIIKFSKRPFRCHVCSDGRSYPEKFMAALLADQRIGYVTQLTSTTFDWCCDKRYDFYIARHNCVIEVNGKQHYEDSTRGRTLEEERRNDVEKKDIAMKNGIKNYFEIDCSESNPVYILNSIKSSGLLDMLAIDFNNISIEKCHEIASKSKMLDVCNLWNDGLTSVKEINCITGVSESAIRSYLRQCNKIGKCVYPLIK